MKQKILIVSLLIISTVVNGQISNGKMSLNEVLAYALKENIDIKKQNLAILKTAQQIKEVKSQGLPKISGSAQLSDNLIIAQQLLPGEVFGGAPGTFIPVEFGTKFGIPLAINANQLLYSQAFLVGLKQAKAAESLNTIQAEKVKQDAIYNIAAAYYQAIIVREQIELIEANLLNVNQSLKVVQSQFENKMARKIDLDQLKVTKSNTQTDYENSKVQFKFAVDQLKVLMGYPLSETLILLDTITDSEMFVTTNTIGKNPTISILQTQMILKDLEIKGIRAGYAPTLSAFGQYNYQAQFNEFSNISWFPGASIGLQLSVPIFDGFEKRYQVNQRKLEMKSIELDQQLFTKNLTVQYNNAVNNFNQNQKNVENQKENLELAQEVYFAMQNNYKNGLASLSDLINSDTGLKSAQSSYLTALLRKKISSLDILLANGSMTDLIK